MAIKQKEYKDFIKQIASNLNVADPGYFTKLLVALYGTKYDNISESIIISERKDQILIKDRLQTNVEKFVADESNKDNNFHYYLEAASKLPIDLGDLGFKTLVINKYLFNSKKECMNHLFVAHQELPFIIYYGRDHQDNNLRLKIITTVEAEEKSDAILGNVFEVLRTYMFATAYPKAKKGAICNMIGLNDRGNLELFELNKVTCDLDEETMKLSYPNSNNTKINTFLQEWDTKGKLLLIHGKPGGGKTTFIRHLLTNIYDGSVVFMNADIFAQLSSVRFISFALENLQNCLLLIEDAEKLLVSREENHEDRSSSVADLLNYTDGLLGDALQMKILATFNTELDKIDAALLRKGRLFHREDFGPLTADQAKVLYKHLTKEDDHVELNKKDSYSLAEIYGLLEE